MWLGQYEATSPPPMTVERHGVQVVHGSAGVHVHEPGGAEEFEGGTASETGVSDEVEAIQG